MARSDASARNWTIRALRGVYSIVYKSQDINTPAQVKFLQAVDELLGDMGAETQTERNIRLRHELEKL